MPCYQHASAPQDPPDLFSRSSSPPKNISHQLSARSSRHNPQDPQHIPSQLQHSLSPQLLRLWLISPARPEHTASDPRHSSHSRSRIFSGASQLWEIQRDDLRARMHQSRSDPRHSFPELRLWLSFRAFRSIRFAQYSCTPRAFQSAQPEQDPLYIVRAYTRAPVLSLLSLSGLIAKLVPSFRSFHQKSSHRSRSFPDIRSQLRSFSSSRICALDPPERISFRLSRFTPCAQYLCTLCGYPGG